MNPLGDVMFSFFDTEKNGFGVLEVPTGSGKTYKAVQAIARYVKEHDGKGRPIYYVTPQKKNIPEDDFKKAFAEIGLHPKTSILRLPSYTDAVLKHLPELISCGKIPKEIQQTKAFQKVAWSQQKIHGLRQKLVAPCEETSIDRDDILDYLNTLEEQMRTQLERDFRKSVRHFLWAGVHPDTKNAKKIIDARLQELRYAWIKELYPSTRVGSFPVTLLSAYRFMCPVDPFDGHSFRLTDPAIMKGSIIIFDEIDAVWKDMEQSIIEESLQMQQDAMLLFKEIFSSLQQELPTPLKEADQKLPMRSLHFEKLKERAEELQSTYHLDMSYHTDSETEEDDRAFLFCGYSMRTILKNDRATHLLGWVDEDANRVTVHSYDTPTYRATDTTDAIFINSMLESLHRYFQWFGDYVRYLAGEYQSMHTEQSAETSIATVFSAIRLSNESREFLYNASGFYRPQKKKDRKLAYSYYQRGFSLFSLENAEDHAENTNFLYMRRNTTPEKIVGELAQRTRILGLSATAFFRTGNNLNYEYLSDFLKAWFIDLQSKLVPWMEEEEHRMQEAYHEHGIHIHIYTVDGKAARKSSARLETILQERYGFSEDEASILRDVIERHVPHNDKHSRAYCIERYLELIPPILDFCEHQEHRAWLFQNQKMLTEDSKEFSESVVRQIVALACHHFPGASNPEMLVLRGKDYDHLFGKMQKKLRDGKRVMVFAAYPTTATGQNPQFDADEDERNRSVCIFPDVASSDARMTKKDFDGIVLGDITHFAWSVHSDDETREHTQRSLLEGISEIENLVEMDVISVQEGNSAIREILKVLPDALRNGRMVPTPRALKGLPIYRTRVTQQVIQTLGRLSRSFLKNKDITIYASQKVIDMTDRKELLNGSHHLTPEQRKFAESLPEYQAPSKQRDSVELRKAERISVNSNEAIGEFLGWTIRHKWDEPHLAFWLEKRLFALRYPSFDSLAEDDDIPQDAMEEIAGIHYFEKADRIPKYLFYAKNDFREIKISFDGDREAFARRLTSGMERTPMIQEMSEASARLPILLRYPGMRSYFEEHRFATSFGMGRYVMTPALYNNIYKGALGEVAGRFILQDNGILLNSIQQPDIFELFDFQLSENPRIFIDFKHWRHSFFANREYTLNQIDKKLKETGGEKAIIVNLIDTTDSSVKNRDHRIFEIPGLLDGSGRRIQKNIDALEDLIHGHSYE